MSTLNLRRCLCNCFLWRYDVITYRTSILTFWRHTWLTVSKLLLINLQALYTLLQKENWQNVPITAHGECFSNNTGLEHYQNAFVANFRRAWNLPQTLWSKMFNLWIFTFCLQISKMCFVNVGTQFSSAHVEKWIKGAIGKCQTGVTVYTPGNVCGTRYLGNKCTYQKWSGKYVWLKSYQQK